MTHLLEVRPCGVCVAYVPYDSGCEHWRPLTSASRRAATALTPAGRERERLRKQKARAAAKVAREVAAQEFRRVHRLPPLV